MEPQRYYTPVKSKRGKLVHAVDLRAPERTACGKKYSGWAVAEDLVTCTKCLKSVCTK